MRAAISIFGQLIKLSHCIVAEVASSAAASSSEELGGSALSAAFENSMLARALRRGEQYGQPLDEVEPASESAQGSVIDLLCCELLYLNLEHRACLNCCPPASGS